MTRIHRITDRFLRVPLLAKLVVADVGVNLLTFLTLQSVPTQLANEVFVAAVVVTMVLNGVLVWWALLPLRDLEHTANAVSRGNLAARVPRSRFVDRNIARIGRTFNTVLDGLTNDRERVRQLASQVISAADQERAHIARELHDSTAQSLSALDMLVTASLRETAPGALHDRLEVMRDIVVDTLAEVRTLSHNVHPRVLDDLGLVSALESLARRTREGSGVDVVIEHEAQHGEHGATPDVPAPVASVLYRVAQEGIRNAVRHSAARRVIVHLVAGRDEAVLVVRDDGIGFDVAAARASARGMGLFLMHERLALIDGTLTIDGGREPGTELTARAPLTARAGLSASTNAPHTFSLTAVA